VITVATSAAGGFVGKDTVNYMELCAKNMGMHPCGKINIIGEDFPKDASVKNKEEQIIRQVMENFIKSIQKGNNPTPSLKDLFWFRIWQTTTRIGEKEKLPDFRYWTEKGWYESDYYYDTPIDPITKAATKTFGKIVRNQFKNSFKDKPGA
jgi:hypothetical protein